MSSTCRRASIVACRSFLVELIPCLGRTKCPFVVAVDSGRCLVRRSDIRPGNVHSWLFFAALVMIEREGDLSI